MIKVLDLIARIVRQRLFRMDRTLRFIFEEILDVLDLLQLVKVLNVNAYILVQVVLVCRGVVQDLFQLFAVVIDVGLSVDHFVFEHVHAFVLHFEIFGYWLHLLLQGSFGVQVCYSCRR